MLLMKKITISGYSLSLKIRTPAILYQNQVRLYEAAKQFGKFTSLLSRFNASRLHITVPDFHNLTLRLDQFKVSVQTGNKNRIEETGEGIDFLIKHESLAGTFKKLKRIHPFL